MTASFRSNIPISQLRRDLAGEVIAPSDEGYDRARRVFMPAVDRRPEVIIRPRDADEVAYVVTLARVTGVDLAVRGGGHSLAGHGVGEGGIVLDLSLMKKLEVDLRSRVASAETGLTAGAVTAATAAHGLGISFGDTASVGIGGLTLGGGIGYMVRKHGLTIDQLLAADVVTADGRLLHVSDEEHPDLFWAIRGGGGNFGVATGFRYRLQPVETVTGGLLVLPATARTIAEFIEAAEAAPDELSGIGNVMPAPPLPFVPSEHHGSPVVLAMLVHVGPADAGAEALAPFRSLATPLADLLRPISFADVYPPEDPDYRPLSATRTLFVDTVDRDVSEHILERLRSSTAQLPVAQLRVLGGAMARVPTGSTAFAHRSSRIMVNTAAVVSNAEELPVQDAWVEDFAAELRGRDTGAYVNFLGDEGAERVRSAYPGPTWDRLTAVKRRYDPENVFRLNQNIPPAAATARLDHAA